MTKRSRFLGNRLLKQIALLDDRFKEKKIDILSFCVHHTFDLSEES